MCWYCEYGWPERVQLIYDEAVRDLNKDTTPLQFGPAHIVWEDSNFDGDSIQWCLEHFNEHKGDLTEDQLDVVHDSLLQLLLIPEQERNPAPEDQESPPPPGTTLILKHRRITY